MSLGYDRDESNGVHEDESGVRELLKCVLKRFGQVSVNRIHKISFMLEYEYHEHENKRITNAAYYRVMDGCRSDAISEVLGKLEVIERKKVDISGETIETIVPQDGIDCNPDVGDTDSFEEIADYVVQTYGDIPPEEINAKMGSIPIYRDTKLGEKIEF